MRRLIHPIKYNSLTIVLSGLFIICIAAQSLAAWRLQDEILAAHGQASVNYWANLSTGAFLEGLATNWQAAFLQLASLILFGGFLYQRGAPHSRDPLKAKSRKNHTNMRATSPGFTAIPFSVVFVVFRRLACTAYIVFGAKAYNEERAFTDQPPISVAAFMLSAKFWSSTLQTWQAEYLAIALFVVLSPFLRQEGSAESKPVEIENETTGQANK